jgi:hypothetical protein
MRSSTKSCSALPAVVLAAPYVWAASPERQPVPRCQLATLMTAEHSPYKHLTCGIHPEVRGHVPIRNANEATIVGVMATRSASPSV